MALQFVDATDKQKNRKGDNDEAYDRIGEEAVVNCDCTGLLCISKGSIRSCGGALLENEKEVAKINIAQ